MNVVSVLLPFASVVTTVTGYSPTSVGLPLIVLVSGSYVTPSGKPLTSFVTGFPLLSSPLIVIVSIGVFTSFSWSGIASTVGAVVSVTVIVNSVIVSL